MEVELTAREVFHAGIEAALRVSRTVQSGREQRYKKAAGLDWAVDAESCCSEFAVAKALNQYPSGIISVGAPDVGTFVQVRYTERDDGHLIVHLATEGDNPEHAFVLATGHSPSFDLKGWLYGRECQLQTYWRVDMRSPCFMVPQRELRDVTLLMASP